MQGCDAEKLNKVRATSSCLLDLGRLKGKLVSAESIGSF